MEELGELLIKARISNPKLTIVKSDAQSEYGIVSDVIDILW